MNVPAYYRKWRPIYDRLLGERFDFYQENVFELFGLARASGGLGAYFDEVVRQLNLQKGQRAIDVCCGTGTLALKLENEVGPEGEVWGVDLSATLLEVARKKDNCKRIRFLHSNAQKLPFEPGYFDVAAVTTALHEMYHRDRMKILEELFRILKPGGRLAIGEHRKHDRGMMRALWWLLVAPLGFPEVLTVQDMFRCGLEREIEEAGFELVCEVPTNLGFMRVLSCRKKSEAEQTTAKENRRNPLTRDESGRAVSNRRRPAWEAYTRESTAST